MGRIAMAAIASLWVIPISILVNRIVPDPYMDEIFHTARAEYCNGDFMSWDSLLSNFILLLCLVNCKVVLYEMKDLTKSTSKLRSYQVLSFTCSSCCFVYVPQLASSFPEVCSTAVLRSVNGVLAVLCSILVYEIITDLRPALDERKATLFATLLALYLLHWFFTFLYYTDVASLTAVLAMYLACLKKKYLLKGLVNESP